MKAKDETNKGQEVASSRPCPICGKPQMMSYRPFCSKRCADIDLHRWLSGSYVVAGDSSSVPSPEGEESGEE